MSAINSPFYCACVMYVTVDPVNYQTCNKCVGLNVTGLPDEAASLLSGYVRPEVLQRDGREW